jgi:TatD DNase family protein
MLNSGLVLVDTHAHLCDPGFDADIGQVLKRAARAGVAAVIAVGETLADARKNLDLAKAYPMIRAAAGLYPTVLDLVQAEAMSALIRSERHRLVAVGEVGLDYWGVKEEIDRQLQHEIFSMFIDLAMEMNLPLNVHSRSAGRQAVAQLLERGARRVQMHAFDAKAAAALPAVEAGYFFSIPPSVVRSRQKQKLVSCLPLSCLLVETDSPVLGPDPSRRNEPANLPRAIQAIAEIKHLPIEAVAEAIMKNTFRLYGMFQRTLGSSLLRRNDLKKDSDMI